MNTEELIKYLQQLPPNTLIYATIRIYGDEADVVILQPYMLQCQDYNEYVRELPKSYLPTQLINGDLPPDKVLQIG